MVLRTFNETAFLSHRQAHPPPSSAAENTHMASTAANTSTWSVQHSAPTGLPLKDASLFHRKVNEHKLEMSLKCQLKSMFVHIRDLSRRSLPQPITK